MDKLRTARIGYWNPCGSLLAFLKEKIYNDFCNMQSCALLAYCGSA